MDRGSLSQDRKIQAAAAAVTVLTIFTTWLINDYREWISLGTGGTPPTPQGYYGMTKLRISRAFSSDDLRDASNLKSDGPRFLPDDLPQREGPRPKSIGRTMPQRQQPNQVDAMVVERLHNLCKKYYEAYPDTLDLDGSKVEGRSSDAIFAKPNLPGRHSSAQDRILGNEIVHAHHVDNSLHIWLSEPDARMVVMKGWGERFPLSAIGKVHKGLTFIYAPQNMDQLDVIEKIVNGGIGYLTGKKI